MSFYMQYCLYNEDRNLLRIKERERRNQEIHLNKDPFLENAPLFGEPYKTNKGDELSSRIQNMLGNYDEMKDLISNMSQQNFIGIPKRAVPLISQEKCSLGPNRSNNSMQPSVHSKHPRSMGPLSSASSTVNCPSQKGTALTKQNNQRSKHNVQNYRSLHNRSQNKGNSYNDRETSNSHRRRDDKQVDADNQAKVQLSHLQDFQPLLQLSSLVQPLSPLTPLSPLHSSVFTNSRSQSSNSKDCSPSKSPHELGVHSSDSDSLSSGLNAPVTNQHASQTFPPSLPSKPNMTQQKPTAYVRPMDGQDQAPRKSPELKPPSEDCNEESFGNIAEAKVCARTKLSKLKIPSQPIEETISNDVNCVEEILKEMTHSWPPPLTAIQTPRTTEPSKFPFQNKDTLVPSGFVEHNKCEIPPKKSQSEKLMLENDLQISSSDDSDGDQVTEKTVPISVPKSASFLPQSGIFLSRHSSGGLNNLSESGNSSGSDSESETTSTDSEGASSEGASRAPTPEPDPSPANKWQLDNWLNVSQPAMPSKSHSNSSDEHISQDSQRTDAKEDHDGTGSSREKITTQKPSPSRNRHQKSSALHSTNDQQQAVSEKKPNKSILTLVPEANQENEDCRYANNDQPHTEHAKVKVKAGEWSTEKRETKSSAKILSERKKLKSPVLNPAKCKQLTGKGSLSTDQCSNRDEPPSSYNLPSAAPVPQRQENEANNSKLARELSRTTFPKSVEVKNTKETNINKLATGVKDVNRTTQFQSANSDKQETRACINKPGHQFMEEIHSSINKPGKFKEENGNITTKTITKENGSKPVKSINQAKDNILKDQVLSDTGVGSLLSPIRESKVDWPLVVKIDLSLLSRIPSSCKESKLSKNHTVEHNSQKNMEGLKESKERSSSKTKRKHAIDMEGSESKKPRLDKENKLSSSSHKESIHKRSSTSIPEKEKPFVLPLPSPVPKPAKVAHTRTDSASSSSCQVPTMSASDKVKSSMNNSTSGLLPSKHKRMEDKQSGHLKSKVSYQGSASNATPEQLLPNENSKPTRPLLKFDDKQYSVEHHLQEAKKIKHKADVMLDKIGKAFNYLDAALSFVQSGIAMESEAQPPKSAYTMFSETVDLIKYILKLINYNDSSAIRVEKIFVVLCIRCQSLLSMAMFRFKKDTALKYSKALSEHFKSSSRTAQAPSPRVARSTGTPSPLSQTPSPASSGGSQTGSVGNGGSVAVPHVVHQLASTYVNITSIFLHGHDLWEQADALAKKNKEFFAELDAAVGLLSLTSSMTELVHYVRQGLHWLRLETKLL
ncbi:AF4/FMR2 family member 3-like isoform X1 [Hypanus sabinus]|uniref:AF4/FMR2 family member 3-like isoform X1 n=1 Tax=Hypanus sabinus TaxID=79690 RepID=UPI0028C465AA|nr:AF4/FMR2 family member 3-like isoform X1 [Hypanus sabinus]